MPTGVTRLLWHTQGGSQLQHLAVAGDFSGWRMFFPSFVPELHPQLSSSSHPVGSFFPSLPTPYDVFGSLLTFHISHLRSSAENFHQMFSLAVGSLNWQYHNAPLVLSACTNPSVISQEPLRPLRSSIDELWWHFAHLKQPGQKVSMQIGQNGP